jgi:hypothetical protein
MMSTRARMMLCKGDVENREEQKNDNVQDEAEQYVALFYVRPT